jgi:hypothetical protein
MKQNLERDCVVGEGKSCVDVGKMKEAAIIIYRVSWVDFGPLDEYVVADDEVRVRG